MRRGLFVARVLCCAALGSLLGCAGMSDERNIRRLATQYELELFRRYDENVGVDVQEHVLRIARRVAGDLFERAGVELRVRICMNPAPLASVDPNGLIVVNSGLLALVDSQAQLAAALAHEIAHFEHSDYLRAERTEVLLANAGLVAGSIAGILFDLGIDGLSKSISPPKPDEPPPTPNLSEVPFTLSTTGFYVGQMLARIYSRKLELDADQRALELLEASGFRPGAMLEVLELLRGRAPELRRSDTLAGRYHPAMRSRSERLRETLALRADVAAAPAPPAVSADFWAALDEVAIANAALDCGLLRFERAGDTLRRVLARIPGQRSALLVRAECLRRQAPDGPDFGALIAAYRSVLAVDPDAAIAHARLGMLYRRMGDGPAAIEAFESFIHLRPKAPENAILRGYIARLREPALAAGAP